MIGDRELLSFRKDYYEMLLLLLWKEPTGELLGHLSKGIRERTQAARNLQPLLGEGWEEIASVLAEAESETVAGLVGDEYVQLFIGPLGPEVNPYESFYFTGRLLDRPLADIRTFLKTVGIEKLEGYPEPEDSLAFELAVMRWLIEKQMAAADTQEENRFLQLQSDFLKEHLLVWGPACAEDIQRAQGAKFYRAAAKILHGFLELELSFFRQYGLDKIASLPDVRQRYGAVPTWKGPTFDATGVNPEASSPEKED